ncbi:MAG: hypothetical protein R3268_07875 [Acidiferrobacterales bacterium]|nr:hypothetical protein [Acidiferrobacterales bacterium]
MASLDHMRLAHALAKTFVQPGVSDETVEQCIYQIGLVLATNEPGFDLGHWRRLIAKQQASLQQLNGETKVTKARLANRNGRKATTRRPQREG